MPRELPVINSPASEAPPIFERIAIVGFGLIGGSIALAVRQRWRGGLIIAVDRKPILEAAMRVHAADVAADDLGMVSEADLVILAAPVLQNIDVLERLPDYLTTSALVTDVGSTKSAIVAAARQLPERLRFLGGHPFAGAATGGFDSARAELFDGRPWFLTPASPADRDPRLEQFICALGARPVEMQADEHDRLAAYLCHLPQLAVSALMHVVGDRVGADAVALAGRGLRDTTRLASSPPQIWRDIAATNSHAIEEALDTLTGVLQQLRGELTDGHALTSIFESAAEWKRALETAAAKPKDRA